MDAESKIKSRTELAGMRKYWEIEDQCVVFTNGCFDILHSGHAAYLQDARHFGDLLIVGLNSDNSTRRLKGTPRPLMPEVDRAFLLASLQAVDYVCVFDEDTPEALIRSLQPDVLVKGGDYAVEEIVGREIVEARGGQVRTIPLTANRSTTDLVQKIVGLTQKGILQ